MPTTAPRTPEPHRPTDGARLRTFGRVLFWTLVSVYFVACFLIIGARWFVTTQLDRHRDDIVRYLSEATGITLSAKTADAGFHRIRPVLRLENVTLSRPGGPISLELPYVEAELAWSSLWNLEPRFERLLIADPRFTVRRLSETRYDIGGIVLDTATLRAPKTDGQAENEEERGANVFAAWLLAQYRLVLKNGTFTYIDERVKKPQPVLVRDANAIFNQNLLNWTAALEGTVKDQGQEERHFVLRARIEKGLFSDASDPFTWRGEAYAAFDSIDIGRITRRLGLSKYLNRGTGAAQLWLAFDSGSLTSATAEVALSNVHARIQSKLAPLTLQNLQGRLAFRNEDGTLVLSSKNLAFRTTESVAFGPADIRVELTRGEDGKIRSVDAAASSLEIGTLTQLAKALPIPHTVHGFLLRHPISGSIRDLKITASDDPSNPANWRTSFGFYRLTLPESRRDNLPGFRNLGGLVSTRPSGEIVVDLNGNATTFVFPKIFRNPRFLVDELKGRVRVRLGETPTLHFEDVRVATADAEVTARGSWRATGGPGTLELTGELLRAEASAVPKYLPMVVGNGTLTYLDAALLGGRALGGNYTVRGDLRHFPWVKEHAGEGLFRISADVTDGRLDFLPSYRRTQDGRYAAAERWPTLEKINTNLLFEGESMRIWGKSAQSHNLRASGVVVEIPSFSAPAVELRIRGNITGDLRDALGYVNRGPMLREILGDAFLESSASGASQMTLDLTVPLGNPEDFRFSLAGSVEKAAFRLMPFLPEAHDIKGRLLITEHSIETPEALIGKTEGGDIVARAFTKNGIATIEVDGIASVAEVKRLVGRPELGPVFDRMKGSTPVRTTAQVALSESAHAALGSRIRVSGASKLMGISSALPLPFAKAEIETWPTEYSLHAEGGEAHLLVRTENRLDLDLTFRQGEKPTGGIAVGRKLPKVLPDDQLQIVIREPYMSFDDWHPILTEAIGVVAAPKNTDEVGSEAPDRVRVQIGELILDRRRVKDLDVTALRRVTGWDVELHSNDASGRVLYRSPTAKSAESWDVRFSRLYVPERLHEQIGSLVEKTERRSVTSLPNVTLDIEDLQVGERRIGRVELEAASRPADKAWMIRRLAVRNVGGTLTGSGAWTPDAAAQTNGRTELKLTTDVRSIGDVLLSLGVEDAIRQAAGKGTAHIRWAGIPFAPDIASLSGSVEIDARKGAILQVEPGAGRILSLLSMQHLLNRLQLDFSDVAGKGFAFDSLLLRGRLENGLFHADKAALNGSAATVLMRGDVDFVNELLDVRAVVLPQLNIEGASLALAFANPAVGLGTFLAQFVLKDQISEMLRTEYSVTGELSNPNVRKLDRVRLEDLDNRSTDTTRRKDAAR